MHCIIGARSHALSAYNDKKVSHHCLKWTMLENPDIFARFLVSLKVVATLLLGVREGKV